MTFVHVKRCQGKYCSQRKTLIFPKWFPILDGIQKIFSETLFGASRVSRNING